MPATNPILPAFTPQAARTADALDRRLSSDDARRLLNRIERQRREEELAELKQQLAEVEMEIAVVRSEPERAVRVALAKRIKAYIARISGEAS
jgi:MinD-like ATPase involved in chromosome partitioning or flagellar assembly